MNRLQPTETELVGRWTEEAGRFLPDETARRIEALIAGGDLQEVAESADGWSKLFKDPSDGRLWELYFPDADRHGGGPPALRTVAEEEARLRFP